MKSSRLDGVGLVLMGGRVYDLEFGRIYSADPVAQDPTGPQALNPLGVGPQMSVSRSHRLRPPRITDASLSAS